MIQFSEAIKLKDGKFYNLEYHQKRASRTVDTFYKKQIDLYAIENLIPNHAQEGMFKCRVVYSDKIENVEFIPYSFKAIKKVGIIADNSIEYLHKYVDRDNLNKLLKVSGCDDIIIIKNGFVTDSSSANLVFECTEGLFTSSSNLLPGTKRQLLLDRGIIQEKTITVENIKHFEKVYFINAMIDLEDDISIDTDSLIEIRL